MKCPKCESRKVVPIMYGYPSLETIEAYEKEKVILGGCIISDDQPDYGCLEYDFRWSKAALPATDITKVRYKVWENGPGIASEMHTWVYKVYKDGRLKKYTYQGDSRKYEEKESKICDSYSVQEIKGSDF